MQAEARAYTSGRLGMYKWKLRYMKVEARTYTSGRLGMYKRKLRNMQVVETKVYTSDS